MFCSQCGINAGNASFCSNCGASLAVLGLGGPAQASNQAPPLTQSYTSGLANFNPAPSWSPLPPERFPAVTFDEAIKRYFAGYANFNGRSRRSEYWFQFLFQSILGLFSLFMSTIDGGVTYWILILGTVIPQMASSSRRLHDINKSFGYYFFGLIPFVGAIFLIIWLSTDSEISANRFGDSVKY